MNNTNYYKYNLKPPTNEELERVRELLNEIQKYL